MTSDWGSFLELDSFVSEESLRVAMYERALTVRNANPKAGTTEEIASCFIDFVKGERWRFDALNVALKSINRTVTVDTLIEKADKVVAWVESEPEIEIPEPAQKKVTIRKKSRRR